MYIIVFFHYNLFSVIFRLEIMNLFKMSVTVLVNLMLFIGV